MSIVTKTGDKGETQLYSGERVKKSNSRIEAVGLLDELNAELAGLNLENVQEGLFYLGAILADTRIGENAMVLDMELKSLEKEIIDLEAKLPPLDTFILPGGHPQAIQAHRARAVCRRAERCISQISGLPKNALPYLNRLSDYLFCVARHINKENQVEELPWISKK